MRLTMIVLLAAVSLPTWAQALVEAVVTEKEMIVTANPLATAAGAEVLQSGGTAVDAMIAAQAVLGLVEPQASGLGGGAFVVYYDAKTATTTTLDAREKAPAAAREGRFLGTGGEPLGFVQAWQSGLSVGVPGVPLMMQFMHERYGRMPWGDLLEPAIVLAEHGFELTGRTSAQVHDLLGKNPSCAEDDRLFFRDPVAFAYFVDEETCTAKPAGTKMRNADYAQTLKLIAQKSAAAFYTGDMAGDIVAAVRSDPNMPGDMTTGDLADYSVVERAPVCSTYRGYRVCGMGPPSSGGLAVGQILGLLENFELGKLGGPLDPEAVHLFTQAGRLAFADRNRFVGDSDFVTVPAAGMLDKTYLAKRAELIKPRDLGKAKAGNPPGQFDPTAPHDRAKSSGTSHISIIDREGNALSMTTTVESSFGNGVMVPGRGFLLNNQLTDFSFRFADEDGTPIANRVEPGKRPRSSMSPTLVFGPDGDVKFITGSPGGARIIGYTAQSIVNLIDFGLDPQQAVSVPHYMNMNGSTDLEQPIPGVTLEYDVAGLAAALRERGHEVAIVPQTSGLSVIRVDEAGLIGGGDLRRDGTVGGR